MREDFEELDKMFRITEKEEIDKFKQVGKTAAEYYQHKEMQAKGETEVSKEEKVPETTDSSQVLKSDVTSEGMEVKVIKGDDFE